MSILKSRPSEGDIVPIYINKGNGTSFNGMARLVSRDSSFLPIRFIDEEKDLSPTSKTKKAWVKKTHGWVVIDIISQTEDEYFYISSEIDLRVNIKDTTTYIPDGAEIVYENKNYIVIKDHPYFTDVCTQKEYFENDIKPLTRLFKPYDFIIESYEPQSVVYESDRWLVDYLPNPTKGDLDCIKNPDIYYKDMGICDSIDSNTFYISIGGNTIKADSKDLYIDSGKFFRTHAKISYKLTTGSRYYEPKDRPNDNFLLDQDDEW